MSLTANQQPVYEGPLYGNSLPVKGTTEIFLGMAVGLSAGYGRPLTAGDTFVGFADQHINNTSTDGALRVPVIYRGLVQVTITGVGVADVGKDAYASDDATFTLTVGSNSFVGKVFRYVTTNTAIVSFNTGA